VLNLFHCSTVADYYYVYIMASQRRVIYVGVTSNLEQRVYQHKTHVFAGFTARYNVNLLVYFERFATIHAAIAREKEIKAWRRHKKLALIGSLNPKWKDLSHGWYQRHAYAP
jgi:putative endonuclease